MGKTLAKKIRGMSLRTKVGIVFMLLMGSFLYQGILKPLIGVTATNTYYFRTDSTAVNVGADGSTTTSTSTTPNKKISLIKGTPYTTSRSVVAAANTTNQTLLRAYGPVYASKQTLTAPAVTIGARDRNGTTGAINWTAEIYDYNPAGALNNGVLLWTSDVKEAHPSVQTPLELTFSGVNTLPKEIVAGHRIKVVIKCQMANTASSARLYWGSSTNYSFFTVSETLWVADSLTVNNLSDYYSGALTTVTQGDSNVPMLKLDMYSNVAGGAIWTGGMLDRIGTNTTVYLNEDEPGDVTFSIYKDANGDGLFKTTDTKIGGPYRFDQLVGQTYTLDTPQTIEDTPARYFIVYNILRTATYNTTVGAKIVPGYFTVTGASGGVTNVTNTSSSTPNIQFGGTAVTKNYPADWDAGTSLSGISESAGPNITDSTCIVRNTAGSDFPLVGLLNYPASSCASVAGQGYSTPSAQADFARLYFGGAGYHSAMKTIKGTSFVYRVYTPSGGGTVTLQLFYVTSGGVRVNAPITSKYTTTNSVSQTITTSLAGQNFSDVPIGARLGIQIGVTANMRIGLGSSINARLTVQETAAENENVDVGNGTTIANASVYASAVSKVINSFTLSAAKAKTVNSITVKGSPMVTSQNVKEVRIYADSSTLGTLGVLDGTDTLIGSTSTISNGEAVISGLSLAVTTSVKRYLVVVDIGDTPNTNVILTALVSDLTVATTGGIGENVDSSSATINILSTTTLSNFIGAEPVNQIIPWNAPATKVDTFALKTNGGINDTITSVTVTLTTPSSLPAGKVISDYVGRVDILTGAGASLGHLTAPTMADNWQVSTIGLAASQTGTDYYVAITPKGNQNITFTVKGRVTAVSHSRVTNQLLVNDSDSASLILDQHAPTEPVLTAVTGTYQNDTDGAEIDLSWIGSTDASGSAVSYLLVRGAGNAPAPRSCAVDGVKSFLAYQGTATSFTNKNLDEGVSYGYRVCSVDSVNNISVGSAKTTTASIKNRCAELPVLRIDPMNAYLKAGNQVAMSVGIVNQDTGVCAPTTFTLSIVGSDPDDGNFAASHFDDTSVIIPTNKGSKYTHLHVTSKPGAAEKADRTFHVKVTKSSGGEVMCTDPIHVVVNKYGTMMHSSMQLGTTKYGSWGIDYDCRTCHSPTSTNIKQVKNIISTPNGDRPVVFSITSTAANASVAGVFGNDMRSGTASTNVCEVCHHRARYHQYSSSKVAWKQHNNNLDCMKCHPHSIGFKTVQGVADCDDCHGNPPTSQETMVVPPTDVLFPYATNAGSHAKHDARQVACAACHSNGNHFATPTPDKKLNMGFSIKNSNFPGFVGNISSATMRALPPGNDFIWQGALGTTIQQAPATIMTCNVYCHGWEGNGGYNSEPAWTGISQVGCGSCHAATNSIPPSSGSHPKHAGTEPGYGNGIACSVCHGFRNYSSSSSHLNGNVEWDLSTLPGLALYRGVDTGSTGSVAPTAPGSYGSCQNLYCHSNVVSGVNNNGTGAPTAFSTPTWGGTTNCNSCHQAQPNVTGGHPQHAGEGVGEAAFDCRICHANGGTTNSLNHGNDKINFAFAGLGENTHYSYSSAKIPGSAPYGTCYNGNCHGRKNTTWGPPSATPLCEKCHTTNPTAAGFFGTYGPGSTTAKTDPQVGAHFQHITSMPYKYSAKIACASCHIAPTGPYSPGHIDSALPAEVNFGSLAASGLQGTYTSAAHLPTYDFGSKTCNSLWCHGGGMASNEGFGDYGSVEYDGGALGSPVPAVWNVPFLTGVGSNDCVKCHAFPPAAPMPGYNHYDENNNRPYIASQCNICHKHVDNTGYVFKNPALHVNGLVDSCNTCHGRPPIDDATMTNPAIGALGAGMVGAHQAHALNPSIKKDCNVCHDQYAEEMPSYYMEIGFNAYGGQVTRGTFYGYSTLPMNYSQEIIYKSTRAETTVRRTNDKEVLNTCANLYCHGGGTDTLAALAGGSNTKPNWEGGASQAECGSCHGVSGDTYNASGSHRAHVSVGYGKLAMPCYNCHGIKDNNYHVDGQVEWHFYSTAKRLNGLTGLVNPNYTPAAGNGAAGPDGKTNNLAPSASFGTCAVYCHSNGQGTYASPLPVWGAATPMNCGSCHINQTSTFSGAHQKHSGSSAYLGYGIECTVCHAGSGSASPKHINGAIDIIFDAKVVATGTYDSGTCKNISCHVSTVSTGPAWSGGGGELTPYPATCTGCHSGFVGSRDSIVPQFGYDSHHVQKNAGTVEATDCAMCHWEANNSGSRNLAYHAGSITNLNTNASVNLVAWNNGQVGVKTPANRPAVSAATFISYTANGKRTSIGKLNNVCLGCHNSSNAGFKPFNTYSTIRYSWEARSGMAKTSVLSRYSSTTLVKWSIYSTNSNGNAVARFGTNKKSQNAKALSAHGNASKNQMLGWDATNGEDAELAEYTYAGASKNRNVFCYDCHNSHGSRAAGITSSYSSATGRYKGGLLKTTTAGIGGYTADYIPEARTTSYRNYSTTLTTSATFNAGASLCNDCHNNDDPSGATLTKPWSVQNTYSSVGNRYKSIGGYWSTPYFDNYTVPSALRSTYKQGGEPGSIKDYRKPMGGHFGSSINGSPAAHSGEINGLCTPCHDPHGVTNSLGARRQYGVPLLKGTWMTSPYKEDKADIIVKRGGGSKVNSFNGGAIPGYHIDQNTLLNMPAPISGGVVAGAAASAKGDKNGMAFRNMSNSAKKVQTGTSTYTTKLTVAEFGGLCTTCHNQASLTGSATAPSAASAWRSKERIHQAVNGWAATTSGTANTANKIHAYTCSKCHTPHLSRLPRLMVTNCLDANHLGKVASGGTPATAPGNQSGIVVGNTSVSVSTAKGAGRFPGGGYKYWDNKDSNVDSQQRNAGPWWFQTNAPLDSGTLTQPAAAYNSGPYNTSCHNSPTAGGGAYTWGPVLQRWNNKTEW